MINSLLQQLSKRDDKVVQCCNSNGLDNTNMTENINDVSDNCRFSS